MIRIFRSMLTFSAAARAREPSSELGETAARKGHQRGGGGGGLGRTFEAILAGRLVQLPRPLPRPRLLRVAAPADCDGARAREPAAAPGAARGWLSGPHISSRSRPRRRRRPHRRRRPASARPPAPSPGAAPVAARRAGVSLRLGDNLLSEGGGTFWAEQQRSGPPSGWAGVGWRARWGSWSLLLGAALWAVFVVLLSLAPSVCGSLQFRAQGKHLALWRLL